MADTIPPRKPDPPYQALVMKLASELDDFRAAGGNSRTLARLIGELAAEAGRAATGTDVITAANLAEVIDPLLRSVEKLVFRGPGPFDLEFPSFPEHPIDIFNTRLKAVGLPPMDKPSDAARTIRDTERVSGPPPGLTEAVPVDPPKWKRAWSRSTLWRVIEMGDEFDRAWIQSLQKSTLFSLSTLDELMKRIDLGDGSPSDVARQMLAQLDEVSR